MGLKRYLPRGIYGRAALILIVPIVTIQLVVSTAFIQRHYEGVTRQMTQGTAQKLAFILDEFNAGSDAADALARAERLATPLAVTLKVPPGAEAPSEDLRGWFDPSGQAMIETLHNALPKLLAVDVTGPEKAVWLRFDTVHGPVQATLSRSQMQASNPHQLLVLMILTSVLMTAVAYFFLRNQMRPITRLARAAEAFGKGQRVSYRPTGAQEVRAAGAAFLDMRARIERQIEQRTLLLSGVSHDLRTPLTRLRLGLAMLPETRDTADEVQALQGDVAQMERMVEEFLSFARGDAMEEVQPTDLVALLRQIADNALRTGRTLRLILPAEPSVLVPMRPQAVGRAIENLVGNALRFGKTVELRLTLAESAVRIAVEDDGPGIAPDRREEALRPFTRLSAERDPNHGGGVGLGLSIAADVARSHGGGLFLSESEALGGLRAELVLAR